MRVVKNNYNQENHPQELVCCGCTSIIEVEYCDVKHDYFTSLGDMGKWVCPLCGEINYVNLEMFKICNESKYLL